MAMSEGHKDRLRKNRVNLVTYMKIEPVFLDSFHDGNVLTGDMIEEIHNIKTRQAKVGRLLDMLARRGGRAFNRLIEAIKLTEQDTLIEGLCPRTKNIQDPESINDIIHLIDAAPKELAVIPMTDAEKQNRDDFTSAGRIYPVPLESPHGRALIVTYGQENIITTADSELLMKLFEHLHFERKEIICKCETDVVTELRKERDCLQTSKFESFILFLLGSGSNERLNTNQITSLFDANHCQDLNGKPKFFFISNEGEKPVQVSDYGVDELDGTGIVRPTADVKADQFVVEYNANISLGPAGGRFGGSMFIKSLAHSFAKHARESSIIDLLGQVSGVGEVLQQRGGDASRALLYQKSTLRHDFYFCP